MARFKEELTAVLPEMKRLALAITRSDQRADDLVQEACLRAWSRRDQYEIGTQFIRWVTTIMRSIWIDTVRQKRRRPEQELPEPDLEPVAGFERGVHAQLMVSDIRRVCAKLSDEDYMLLMSVSVHGFTYKEVAAELDIPMGTVLSRVSRAKMMIKEALGEQDGGARDDV